MSGADAYNRQVIGAFRAGRGHLDGQPLLLLHHRGAKSGAARVTPLLYWPLTDTTVAVLPSNYGAPSHPAWFHNLLAHPHAVVEIGDATVAVRARVAAPGERRAMLDQMMAATPGVAAAAARTDRELPVVILDLTQPSRVPVGETGRDQKGAS